MVIQLFLGQLHIKSNFLLGHRRDINALHLVIDGYITLPNGNLIQWGTEIDSTNEGNLTRHISFALSFNTDCPAIATSYQQDGSQDQSNYQGVIKYGSVSSTGFDLTFWRHHTALSWIAVG